MVSELILEEVKEGGEAVAVGAISGAECVVGREPGEGLTIDNTVVSRRHGVFKNIRGNWFYRDLASTNGSWVNGTKVSDTEWRLVRVGDNLQFGSLVLRLAGDVGNALPGVASRSLVVFNGEELVGVYPVPEYGRALVIGGNQADIPLADSREDLPGLVVERRGDDVCAFGLSKAEVVTLNGQSISSTVSIKDGDKLGVGPYSISYYFHIPLSKPKPVPVGEMPIDSTQSRMRTWDAAEYEGTKQRLTGRVTFGTKLETHPDSTVAIDQEEVDSKIAQYGKGPQTSFGREPAPGSLASLETKIIVAVGVLFTLALILLVIWGFLL
jgi:pSer/pThr/pTyr-binding forkhead associated (FHA) protein